MKRALIPTYDDGRFTKTNWAAIEANDNPWIRGEVMHVLLKLRGLVSGDQVLIRGRLRVVTHITSTTEPGRFLLRGGPPSDHDDGVWVGLGDVDCIEAWRLPKEITNP